MKILTVNSLETKKAGQFLAKEILKTSLVNKPLIFGLKGDLGGGKTTFIQGFAKGLGVKEKIVSPTFVIMKKFKIQSPAHRKKFNYFYHLDCYRLEKPEEILDLGLKDIFSNAGNIIVLEWADRVRKVLPENTIWIKFKFISKEKREITIKNFKN